MNEGILLASDIDFMIHGIFKVKVFGQEVWITDSHACILIVMAVMVIFAVIANRKLKHGHRKTGYFSEYNRADCRKIRRNGGFHHGKVGTQIRQLYQHDFYFYTDE